MTYYYDFNRKQISTKLSIRSIYGEEISNYSNEELKNLNIYEIKHRLNPPKGHIQNPLQTAEERENEGPVYEIIDGFAVQKIIYIPIDASLCETLWRYLSISKSFETMNKLSEQNEDDKNLILSMENEIKSGIEGNDIDEDIIGNCLKYFYPKLIDDEPQELNYILNVCGLSHLLN